MPKQMKKCSYDNDRCFNLDEKQADEKKVKAKDVFQGYTSKPKSKGKTPPKKVNKKKSKY